jgi:hypothetical protein
MTIVIVDKFRGKQKMQKKNKKSPLMIVSNPSSQKLYEETHPNSKSHLCLCTNLEFFASSSVRPRVILVMIVPVTAKPTRNGQVLFHSRLKKTGHGSNFLIPNSLKLLFPRWRRQRGHRGRVRREGELAGEGRAAGEKGRREDLTENEYGKIDDI